MKVKQFEIWIADLNPTIGTEPGKVRMVGTLPIDLVKLINGNPKILFDI